jgi:hypothetical protein
MSNDYSTILCQCYENILVNDDESSVKTVDIFAKYCWFVTYKIKSYGFFCWSLIFWSAGNRVAEAFASSLNSRSSYDVCNPVGHSTLFQVSQIYLRACQIIRLPLNLSGVGILTLITLAAKYRV